MASPLRIKLSECLPRKEISTEVANKEILTMPIEMPKFLILFSPLLLSPISAEYGVKKLKVHEAIMKPESTTKSLFEDANPKAHAIDIRTSKEMNCILLPILSLRKPITGPVKADENTPREKTKLANDKFPSLCVK